MKKVLVSLFGICFLLMTSGLASATLTTIGTATYLGSDYNLVWDDDNNSNSVVWLDYTNPVASWSTQSTWAVGLDAVLTYNIDAAYSVLWDDAAWRLPNSTNEKNVYNVTTSEMGHLYYVELQLENFLG